MCISRPIQPQWKFFVSENVLWHMIFRRIYTLGFWITRRLLQLPNPQHDTSQGKCSIRETLLPRKLKVCHNELCEDTVSGNMKGWTYYTTEHYISVILLEWFINWQSLWEVEYMSEVLSIGNFKLLRFQLYLKVNQPVTSLRVTDQLGYESLVSEICRALQVWCAQCS